MFDGIGDIFSNVVNLAVTAFTGNPMLGQLASGVVDSLMNDSGSSGNSAFNDVFNQAFSSGFLNGVGV